MKIRRVFILVLLPTLFLDVISNDLVGDLYPAYKLIEEAVKNDPVAMFKIRQTFFPSTNYRYWEADGAEVIPLKVCVILRNETQHMNWIQTNVTHVNGNDSIKNCTVTWNFKWTNSLLLNLIPGDFLLAMDAPLGIVLYSEISDSASQRKLDLDLYLTQSSLPSIEDLEQAVALFLTTSKVLVSPNSDPRYQGYVAREYTYYNEDSYYSKLVIGKGHITYTLLCICITFTLLNALIPVLSITRGKQMFQKLTKITATGKPRVYRAVMVVIILFNTPYILLTLVIHINGHPSIVKCYLNAANDPCNIPTTETSYNYTISILIIKTVVFPFAFITEFLAAVYITKTSPSINRTVLKRFAFIIRVFSVWQLLVLVQITVGLITIPLILLIFVSPARILLVAGVILMVCMITIFIFATIPLPNTIKVQFNRGFFLSGFLVAETLLASAVVCSIFITYYVIVKDGMNMAGVKGYIISLVPTILISTFIWVIKKRLLDKRLEETKKTHPRKMKKMPFKKRESLSTEEETLSSESDTHMILN